MVLKKINDVELIGAQEAAKLLGVNKNKIYEIWKRNEMTWWCIGGTSKYRLSLLISNDFDDILKKVRPVINNPKRMRSIIDAYICRKYAKVAFEEEEWEEAIAGIMERIQNEEGH